MVQEIVKSFVDKSLWGVGEWQEEPDYVVWKSEAGLPCIMWRNDMRGFWCGYVCLPENHPWHGKKYDAYVCDDRCSKTIRTQRSCCACNCGCDCHYEYDDCGHTPYFLFGWPSIDYSAPVEKFGTSCERDISEIMDQKARWWVFGYCSSIRLEKVWKTEFSYGTMADVRGVCERIATYLAALTIDNPIGNEAMGRESKEE